MNLHYNKASNLVFKSDKEKIVIGRLDEEKKFIEFDEKTLELCNEFGFKPDPSKIDDEQEEVADSSQEEKEEVSESEVKNQIVQQEVKVEKETVQIEKNVTSLQSLLQSIENLFKEKDQKIKELELHLALSNNEIRGLKQNLNKYADVLNSLNNLNINLNPK